jgi:dipeptidyl aminopeptidase/acylaminoacyl peptidase
MRVELAGGSPQTIAPDATGRAAWASRETVIFTDSKSRRLHRIAVAGGTASAILTESDDDVEQHWPSMLPDGDHFVYLAVPRVAGAAGSRTFELRIGSMASRTSQRLGPSASMAVFAPPRTLLLVRDGVLWAQPFDPGRRQLAGDAVRVADTVVSNRANGRGAFDASRNGVIVFRNGVIDFDSFNLNVVSRSGERVQSFTASTQVLGPALAPDGKRIAFHRIEPNGGDVWIADLADGLPRRFTFDASQENASPVWSPDGKAIAFRSRRGGKWGLYLKPADGVGSETLLAEFDMPVSPMTWSPDGGYILAMVNDPKRDWDIWQYSMTEKRATPLLDSPFREGFPQLSPDGRWLAYTSNSSGSNQLFVQSFPSGRGLWQATTAGVASARWRGDGRELITMQALQAFGASGYAVSAIGVTAEGEGLRFGPSKPLFKTTNVSGPVPGYSGNYMPWAVSADGQRFFLQQSASAERQPDQSGDIVVVMNAAQLAPRQ